MQTQYVIYPISPGGTDAASQQALYLFLLLTGARIQGLPPLNFQPRLQLRPFAGRFRTQELQLHHPAQQTEANLKASRITHSQIEESASPSNKNSDARITSVPVSFQSTTPDSGPNGTSAYQRYHPNPFHSTDCSRIFAALTFLPKKTFTFSTFPPHPTMASLPPSPPFMLARIVEGYHVAVHAADARLDPPKSYLLVQTSLVLCAGLLWTMAYLFYSIRAFRDHKSAMPIYSLYVTVSKGKKDGVVLISVTGTQIWHVSSSIGLSAHPPLSSGLAMVYGSLQT